ncbi:hypothetical protein [Aquimarina aggregata]|uniref:hypothetical protein n=1 Tax=Aquimarina aggregata TaxID=1642818 RepID=UPI0024916A4B|nr:hypothetical protein [Aquimarina aggregata]
MGLAINTNQKIVIEVILLFIQNIARQHKKRLQHNSKAISENLRLLIRTIGFEKVKYAPSLTFLLKKNNPEIRCLYSWHSGVAALL